MSSTGIVRIKRQMMIYTVLQVALTALLLLVSWKFQEVYAGKGALNAFFNSIFMTIGLQVLLLYPIFRFAGKEARNEIVAQQTTNPDELKALRSKRIFGDYLKTAIFIFYGTFMFMAPAFTFILSTAFFSFIATTLTYLKSYNFAAKKILAEK
ncbi:MAG: hypothetical protein U1D97_15860 [Desulfuromonadales bacterium]|nr:hypothetical protein [Desulfuromonadales bacterium]